MGVVKDIYDTLHSKLLNKGTTMMFVGYYIIHRSHVYRMLNLKTNNVTELKVDGLFIAIGHDPATSLFKDQLNMDKEGYLITKPDSTETNIPGVFAAGDVKDKIFRQAVTAAGMGCMSALEAEKFLSH